MLEFVLVLGLKLGKRLHLGLELGWRFGKRLDYD